MFYVELAKFEYFNFMTATLTFGSYNEVKVQLVSKKLYILRKIRATSRQGITLIFIRHKLNLVCSITHIFGMGPLDTSRKHWTGLR